MRIALSCFFRGGNRVFRKFHLTVVLILIVALSFYIVGCGSSSSDHGDFTHSTDVQSRIDELKTLLTEEMYDTITAQSRNNNDCREGNRADLGFSDLPNGQWYYTHDNIISGMAQLEEFANEGSENIRKLEIAAFLANIAQETGGKVDGDRPGCYIQEVNGWLDPTKYNSDACGSTLIVNSMSPLRELSSS